MHHFLKPVAIAVLAFAAVGAAQASVPTLTATPAPVLLARGDTGNSSVFFSVWDGDTSYTRGLPLRMDDYFAGVAASGLYSFTLAPDALFLDWLTRPTTNVTNIQWGMSAIDTLGARRAIETHAQGVTPIRRGAGEVRTTLTNVDTFLADTNAALRATPSATMSAFAVSTDRHYGGSARYGINSGLLGWNRTGTELTNSIETGLNLVRIDAASTGVDLSTLTPQNDGGAAFPLRVWIDFDRASPTFGYLNVAAVPEPETYAMLLAGLGLMGAIAARRRRQG